MLSHASWISSPVAGPPAHLPYGYLLCQRTFFRVEISDHDSEFQHCKCCVLGQFSLYPHKYFEGKEGVEPTYLKDQYEQFLKDLFYRQTSLLSQNKKSLKELLPLGLL